MTRLPAPRPDGSERVPKPAVRRMQAVRRSVRARPGGSLGWRIGVTVVGVVVVAGGMVLLPLPGPGWLVIFAGLRILATEYAWATRLLGFAQHQVRHWTDWVRRQPRWIQSVVGLLGVVVVGAVLVVVYLVLWA